MKFKVTWILPVQTLLDRCFSDIEQFVVRIQRAAEAFKQLDTRKSVRVNKNVQQLGGKIFFSG